MKVQNQNFAFFNKTEEKSKTLMEQLATGKRANSGGNNYSEGQSNRTVHPGYHRSQARSFQRGDQAILRYSKFRPKTC